MLSKQFVKELKAKAHSLKPVVMIGAKGLTEAVIKEIDGALDAHELIKVKASQMDREDKGELAESIASQTESHFINNIGGVFIFYRERKED